MIEDGLALARRLAPGHWCSGEALAGDLGCTRAAVWKRVEQLRSLGVAVEARAGKGYRMVGPLELLNRAAILEALGSGRARLADLGIVAETGSTNADLLARQPDLAHAHALLAETQTGGRGRRGRSWFSPFARNVYLSLGWRFEAGLGALGFLPLVVAVAVARALEQVGLTGHGVKWPNDLVHGDGKLGGCLVEVRGDLGGPCLAVMGVGLNVDLRGAPGVEAIDQAWTDLGTHVPGVSRNDVAAALLDALLAAVPRFEAGGFGPFEADWNRYDRLAGKPVTLSGEGAEVQGTARGLGPRGGLRIEEDGAMVEYLAGEVSVRSAAT